MIVEKFEPGDFVRNKIHGYTTMLYKEYSDVAHMKNPWSGWDAVIVYTLTDWTNDFIKVGTFRSELSSELEKVPSSLILIIKAKEYLDKLNNENRLDNLTYIEILHKLNEQEKELLKNESTL